MSEVKVIHIEYGQIIYQCSREEPGYMCDLAFPICEECEVQAAIEHHQKHGDMDGHTCLLNECALHYPKSSLSKGLRTLQK